jgi:hypothetical protein
MFGRRTKELEREILTLRQELASATEIATRLRQRVDVLEHTAGDQDMAVISHAEIRRPSILVGETRVSLEHAVQAPERGMSLRDYFAGQALVGMWAHPANERPCNIAAWAYEVADAMLAAREAEAPEIA